METVLIIDVEEKDIGRRVNYVSVQGGGSSYIVGTMGKDVRLRPLPQRKLEWYCGSNARDWNACLDAITGKMYENDFNHR